jgi:hypothetical protein
VGRAARIKRVVGAVLVAAAAGGALFVATPSSAERTSLPRAVPRDARAVPVPRAVAQSSLGSFGARRGARARPDDETLSGEVHAAKVSDEPTLEPWSLIAGGLAVMIFIARRRRQD